MHIVTMGGGTGLSTLLQGLKKYVGDKTESRARPYGRNSAGQPAVVKQLTAVVTVTDDGGSSGRLRRDFRVLPPGDIRNCLVALSQDTPLLSRLFQYRFSSGRGLKGHSFGNLFLTALTAVTGDFQEAVRVSGEVLATRGHIYPSTKSDITLEALLEDGSVVRGETHISRSRGRIVRLRLAPPNCRPLPEVLEELASADAITVGPGSLFTSLIPNLLLKSVARQVSRSRAARIYVCNLMTQPGETTNFSAADHLRAIYEHCGLRLFDYVLLNNKVVSAAMCQRYLAERSKPVEADAAALEAMGIRVIQADLLVEEKSARTGKKVVRHHPDRLAKAVLDIAMNHSRSQSEDWSERVRAPRRLAAFPRLAS